MHKTIYVSGAMTGFTNFNFLNFFRAERHLKKLGWDVHNPARETWEILKKSDCKNFAEISMDVFAKEDCEGVIACDAIYMLEGWERSFGAKAEHSIAVWLKKEIYYQSSL